MYNPKFGIDVTKLYQEDDDTLKSNVNLTSFVDVSRFYKKDENTLKKERLNSIKNELIDLEGGYKEGTLQQKTFNPGALVYSSWMDKYGAKKGPRLPAIDNPENRELYTAVFPDRESGEKALEERLSTLYDEVGGDLERIASIYPLGLEPNQLQTDRQFKIKERYFNALSKNAPKEELLTSINRRENDVQLAVINETEKIKSGNSLFEDTLELEIFNPTRDKFELSQSTISKMESATQATTSVDSIREKNINFAQNGKNILPEGNPVEASYISDIQKTKERTQFEEDAQNAKIVSLNTNGVTIRNEQWKDIYTKITGASADEESLKGLASSWLADVGNIVIGELDFLDKAVKAFDSNKQFQIARIDESGKAITNAENLADLFVSTLTAVPELGYQIYLSTRPTTDPLYSTPEAQESRDFVIKNPFTTALFALGIKSMIPVKGFPKPKANPKFDSLMDESVNAFKTANEIKKGNIKPEDVAPSIQKLANFIKNPDIIDNTIKRAESKNYVLKQTPIADKKAIKIAKSELPDLLRNYVQTESKLYYENQNLTQNQISSLQRSKQTLSNLISENLIKVGNENTVTYLEGSTGIPKALAKKGVDALRKILKGETNVVLPRDFVDALKSKNPVRKANDIDEFFGSDYKKSAEIYEANDNKIQEFRFNNNVNNIKKIKSKIKTVLIDPSASAVDVLKEIQKNQKFSDNDLSYMAREVENRLRLSSGASAKSKNKLRQVEKNIYNQFTKKEISLLDQAIIRKADISLKKYNTEQKIPDLKRQLDEAKTPSEKRKITLEIKQRENYNYITGKNVDFEKAYASFEKDPTKGLGGNQILIDKINSASETYFNFFKEINDYKFDNDILTAKQRDALNVRDYEPTKYLETLADNMKIQDSGGNIIDVRSRGVKTLKGGKNEALTRITDSYTLLRDAIISADNLVFRNKANEALGRLIFETNKFDPEFASSSIGTIPKTPNQKIKAGYKRISFYTDKGKQRFIDLQEDFANGWTQTGGLNNNTTIRNILKAVELLSLTPVRRFTATNADWAFALKDNIRNIQYATLKTHDIYSPVLPKAWYQMQKDIIKAFPDVWNQRGGFTKYVDNGGSMDFLSMQGSYQGNIFAQKPKGVRAKFRALNEIFTKLNNTTEMASRVAVMNRLEAKGFSTLDAVAKARGIIDFNIKGGFGQLIEPAFPYTNAGIRATYGLYEGFKQNKGLSLLKYGQLASMASGLYYLVNRNTKDKKDFYDNDVSEYDKFNNFVFVSPFEMYDELGNKRRVYFTIPKDNGAKIVTSLLETALEIEEGKPIREFRKKRVLKALTELSPVNIRGLPLGLKLLMGHVLNSDLSGMPTTQRPLDDKSQYTKPTDDEFFRRIGDYTNISPADLQWTYDELTSRGFPLANGIVDLTDSFLNAVDPDTQELYNKEASKMFGVDKPLPKRFINSFTSDFIKFGQSALSEEVRTNIYEDEQNRIGERNTLFNKASRYAYFVTREEKRGNQQKAKQFENEYYEFLSNIKDENLSQSVNRHYIKEASIKESDLIKNFIRPIINISQPEIRAMVYHHEISRDSYTIDDIIEMNNQVLKIKGFASKDFKREFNSIVLETRKIMGKEYNKKFTSKILFEE